MANENDEIAVPLNNMNNEANDTNGNGNENVDQPLLAPHPLARHIPQQQARSCSSSFWPPSRATIGTLSLAGLTISAAGFMWTFSQSATSYPTLANVTQMPAMILMLGSLVSFGTSFCNTETQHNHAAQP